MCGLPTVKLYKPLSQGQLGLCHGDGSLKPSAPTEGCGPQCWPRSRRLFRLTPRAVLEAGANCTRAREGQASAQPPHAVSRESGQPPSQPRASSAGRALGGSLLWHCSGVSASGRWSVRVELLPLLASGRKDRRESQVGGEALPRRGVWNPFCKSVVSIVKVLQTFQSRLHAAKLTPCYRWNCVPAPQIQIWKS